MVAFLDMHFDEKRIAVGVTNTGGVVEIMSAPGGKTWTIIITMGNMTCAITAGEDLQLFTPKRGEGI